jgi:hypothetical protein
MFGLFFGFILGVICCIVVGIIFVTRELKKLEQTKKNLLEEIAKKRVDAADEKVKGFRDRFLKVDELTKQQLAMLGQLDQPSKNALHSRWKNDINQEIKLMEEEKMDILRSILKDGYDPTLPVLNGKTQEREHIKLSDFLQRHPVETPKDSEPSEPGIKKVGKFTVYRGGNDDTSH